MKDIIAKLTSIISPTGFEEGLTSVIADYLKPLTFDVDFMGNLTIRHHGKGPKIMVVAGIDEDSVVVNHIEKEGFLRFYPSTNLKESDVLNRQIVFPNGTVGFIGAEEVKEGTTFSFEKMFIDIGAADKKAAGKLVQIGDHAGFQNDVRIEGDRIVGGVAKLPASVLAYLAKEYDGANNLVFAFAVQGRVGGRGAASIVTREFPDLIVTIENLPATDTPNCPDKAKVELDKGPALVFRSGWVGRDPHSLSVIEETAATSNIPIQRVIKDAYDQAEYRLASLLSSIPMVTVAIPYRRFGVFGAVASITDTANTSKLLSKALRKKLTK